MVQLIAQAYLQATNFDSTTLIAYIPVVFTANHSIMASSRRRSRRPSLLPALAVAAALLSPFADAAERGIDEPEPVSALGKLQDLGSRASALATRAISMIGIRYRYGGNAPESGLDCSGLVRYLFKEVWGTQLPRTSAEISQVGQHVDTQDLQPGDLVFYNTLKRGFSHVGIYLGDRKFIHAPSAGGEVRIESMDVGYWKKRFNGARRILQSEEK